MAVGIDELAVTLREALTANPSGGRAELIRTALANLPRIAGLSVPDRVKRLIEERFAALAEPSPVFEPDHAWFAAWSRIAALERFPAGQLDFEISGLPRSWMFKVRDRMPLLRCIAELGGFRPLFFTHVAVKTKQRVTLTENEMNRSYRLVAETLKLQP